jgi:hypothetical protein
LHCDGWYLANGRTVDDRAVANIDIANIAILPKLLLQ